MQVESLPITYSLPGLQNNEQWMAYHFLKSFSLMCVVSMTAGQSELSFMFPSQWNPKIPYSHPGRAELCQLPQGSCYSKWWITSTYRYNKWVSYLRDRCLISPLNPQKLLKYRYFTEIRYNKNHHWPALNNKSTFSHLTQNIRKLNSHFPDEKTY